MLNRTNLARIDLNLLVLFEAVLEERHVGPRRSALCTSRRRRSAMASSIAALMNDPLFLRQPKGVAATERARQLAAPIAEILERTRQVIERAEALSIRAAPCAASSFGAPDALTAVLLPGLLAELRREAPGIDLGVRNLSGSSMPRSASSISTRSTWRAIAGARGPGRFVARTLLTRKTSWS
jgi:DNA-binding transcriptional LysR family regulator